MNNGALGPQSFPKPHLTLKMTGSVTRAKPADRTSVSPALSDSLCAFHGPRHSLGVN